MVVVRKKLYKTVWSGALMVAIWNGLFFVCSGHKHNVNEMNGIVMESGITEFIHLRREREREVEF